MRFGDLKIAHKLLCFFLLIVVFLISVGYVGYFVSQSMSDSMQIMYQKRMQPMHILDECRAQNKEAQVITQALLLIPMNKADQNNLLTRGLERFNAIDSLLIKYEGLVTGEIEKQWLAELWNEMTLYRIERQDAINIALTGNQFAAYEQYLKKALLHLDNSDALLQVMADHNAALAESQYIEGYWLAAWSNPTIVFISLVCVILALILGWMLNRIITQPLNNMLIVVEEVAAGNYSGLAGYVPVCSQDEIGKLSQGFYKMSHALQKYFSELAEKNQQIYAFAYQDALTGLPNRRQFIDRMEILLREGEAENRGIAVLFIDLDSFKDINDTLGHNTGDGLLIAVAGRLALSLPEADTVARLGGDEFTIIFSHNAARQKVTELAQKILAAFLKPFSVSNNAFYITASIGISMCPHDGNNVDALLRAADTAMYAAKRRGKNNFQYYTEEMHEAISRRMILEKHLRTALQEEQLKMYYQPKVDPFSGQITGMEALIRWHDSELGEVSPAEFIPIAEETGLIIPLGAWVLRTVCRQNMKWQQEGVAFLRVAVNLSPRQFHQQQLVEQIIDILHETGLESKYLELEITEGALMDKTDETMNVLRQMKEIGIFISIDDFGTGYSSLEYLKQFPIDCLKIDKTFIDEINKQSMQSNIAQVIITLGNSLNLKVVAEGVETAEQLDFLKNHRCDEVQGYYFYHPLPIQDFEQLMRSKRGNGCQATLLQ
ncbi:MAG TPA: EAL domain-containing protein [Methylomusa anaerophila]|uniref:Cyclic di-GMP phosphodiesterase Gmr n=1 Tax=Methylomusa anaerophila TaxID=1930071 RepID=A0A348AFT5_9FIRM|nr:EAL domain-containing protein [Methylomusa anaerophila]BBB89933.1 cyclic di-GMP phosphodiesterase Gmr [Methylomusa anaerophila]HML88340.1 EAL domain-containing protein [Methylomusa anaerophila]